MRGDIIMTSYQTNLPTLAGLRGFAMLWVMAAHVALLPAYDAGFGMKLDTGIFEAPLQFVQSAVDIFILLSGFFLYRNYQHYFRPNDRGWVMDKFYLLRFARLWPVHALAVAWMGLIHWQGIAHPIVSGLEGQLMQYWPLTLLLNLTLMNGWGIVPVASWNEPAWTVSALWFVYLIFPVWIMLVQRANSKASQIAGIAGMLLLLELLPLWITGLSMTDGFGCLLRAFCFFMAGCFTCRLYENNSFSRIPHAACFVALVVLFFVATHIYLFTQTFPLIFIHVFYPLFVLTLVYSKGWVAKCMSCRPFMWLEKVSYSFYLLHYPFVLTVKHYFGAWYESLGANQPLLWLHFVLLTVILALLCWPVARYIEKPIYHFMRGKL